MKRIVLLLMMVLSGSLAHSEVKRLAALSDDARSGLVKIASTETSNTEAPSIAHLAANLTFFANMNSFGMDTWFTFQSKQDANILQRVCYNGGACSVDWYYLDEKNNHKNGVN